DGPGQVVDVAVEMVRLPDDRTLADLAATGRLTSDQLEAVGRTLAAFHAQSPRAPGYGTPEALAALVTENFETTVAVDTGLDVPSRERVHAFQRSLLDDPVVARRHAEGRTRDGHGDLRTDHVYLLDDLATPRVVVIDGVEFDVAYRAGDVAMDIAFLGMDLWLHVSREAAERLLATWTVELDDAGAYAVLDRYMAYRAWVRGKVRAMSRQPEAARQRFALAATIATCATEGGLVAVSGPIAAGKSTLARQLAQALAAPHFAADRLRKRIAGVSEETSLGERPFAGAYAPEATDQVYDGLIERARHVWRSGRVAIVDASFRDVRHHAQVRKAAAAEGVPVRFVRCEAPVEVLRTRLRARDSGPSDAREPLLEPFLARYEPPRGDDVVAVDTSQPVDVEAVLTRLGITTPW
ncbi:MAG: AAA family ATPase, partial [Myxococcota bacterium]